MSEEIPLARPVLGPAEEQAVVEVLRSGRLSLGPRLAEFENAFAARLGVAHASAVSSGTAGLHLAFRALGVGRDDCVVTTSFTFVASANAVTYEGAEPVLLDIDPDTLTLSLDALRTYLESCKEGDDGALRDPVTHRRVAAVEPVDVFGHPVHLERVREITAPWRVPVVADACEALGSRWRRDDGTWVHAGAGAEASVFAFYANKQITTGEGGMVTGADPDIDERIRSLRNQGRRPGDPWLHHTRIGFNYRLSEVQSAIGVAQMRRIDELLGRRAALAARYAEALAEVEEVTPPVSAEWARPAWFVMALRCAPGVDRDRVLDHLNRNGVESKAYFEPPVHRQPPYAGRDDLVPAPLTVTEEAAAGVLIVPFFAAMPLEDVDRVVAVLKQGLAA